MASSQSSLRRAPFPAGIAAVLLCIGALISACRSESAAENALSPPLRRAHPSPVVAVDPAGTPGAVGELAAAGDDPVDTPIAASAAPALPSVLRYGMTEREVLAIEGQPTSRFDSGRRWWYGSSSVVFRDGRLVAAASVGNLHLPPPSSDPPELHYRMPIADVVKACGIPTDCMSEDIVFYGTSKLTFHDNALVAVRNDGNLRVAAPQSPSAVLPAYGLSEEEVVARCGMPTERYPSANVWMYGTTALHFRAGRLAGVNSPPSHVPPVAENGDVRGLDNDGDGRAESVHVRGYYRRDGTYVRGHYRARPRRR